MEIKVFGERNSGNNYLMQLLKANFKEAYFPKGWVRKYGWTHGVPKVNGSEEDVLFLVIVKNPYSWLLSMQEHPHIPGYTKKTFSEFIRSPLDGYETPMLLWSFKYFSFIQKLRNLKFVIIKYELMLSDPKTTIEMMAKKYKVKRRGEFKNVRRSTKSNGTLSDHLFDKKDFYLNDEWKDQINKEDYAFINDKLDKFLMQTFNYGYCTDPLL